MWLQENQVTLVWSLWPFSKATGRSSALRCSIQYEFLLYFDWVISLSRFLDKTKPVLIGGFWFWSLITSNSLTSRWNTSIHTYSLWQSGKPQMSQREHLVTCVSISLYTLPLSFRRLLPQAGGGDTSSLSRVKWLLVGWWFFILCMSRLLKLGRRTHFIAHSTPTQKADLPLLLSIDPEKLSEL